MDTDTYLCFLALTLAPAGHSPPRISVSIDTQVIYADDLLGVRVIQHDMHLPKGTHRLRIDYSHKAPDDAHQAVKIEKLSFNDISDQKFIWKGIYRPEYPEPWFSQQVELGYRPEPEITNTDYLGWNGSWSLDITSPIFTWIHRTQDLGWIYD